MLFSQTSACESLLPKHIDAFVRETMERIEDLRETVRTLPGFDEDGYSACAFAEQLYVQKEELQVECQWRLGKLNECLAATEAEIKRCEHNLAATRSGEAQLHGDEARKEYARACNELAFEHRQSSARRDKICAAIKAMDEALEASHAKLFPHRRPRREYGTPLVPLRAPGDPELQLPDGSVADRELEDIMRLDGERRNPGPDRGEAPPPLQGGLQW